MQEKEENIEQAKKQALKISIEEGAADRVTFGLGQGFITNFALALKANSFHIGLLSSLSSLFYQIVMPAGNKLMEKKSRKEIMLRFVFIECLLWFPLAIIGFLAWRGIISLITVYATIIFFTLLNIARGMTYPAWFSWLGDLVPENQRGKFFSKRNLAIGIVEIATTLIGIALIRAFEQKNLLILGFCSFFLLSALFRIISFLLIQKQYEPKFVLKKRSEFSFWSFIERYDNFGKYAVYLGMFNLALMIASPFFMVYMIKELEFSTSTAIAIMVSGGVFYLLFLPLMGKISDRYGNLKLLYLANIAFALTPLLWIPSKDPLFLGIVPQLFIGLANAAYAIALTNFTYDSVSPEHRGTCASYVNILVGIGTCIGSLIGGVLLNFVSISTLNVFFLVFIFSAILRAVVAAYFLPKIREEKQRKDKIILITGSLSNPFKSLHHELVNLAVMTRKSYAEGLKVWKNSSKYVLQQKAKKRN